MKENKIDYKLYQQREHGFYHEAFEVEDDFLNLVITGNTAQIEENKRLYGDSPNEGKGNLSKDPLKNQIYHMVINTAMVTRACRQAGLAHELSYTLSDIYIQKTDACKTPAEVMELNDQMVMDFAKRMKDLHFGKTLSSDMNKVVNYIYDHLHTNIYVDDLSNLVNMSRGNLSRIFKKETGMCLSDFINICRLETAKNMLRRSDYDIVEISNTLCYASQSYFCSKFKKYTGKTPSQYRKN